MTYDMLAALRPLLTAEADAEAHATGTEPADLEQAVWLRLLEHLATDGPPVDPQGWLRRAVRAESRRNRRTARRERGYVGDEPAEDGDRGPEQTVLTAARHRALRDAVHRLPARCSRLLDALLSPEDLTYREIAGELGISQGSVGPERSRCLGCLRRLLPPEVAAREVRG
ncbi:sigma-70 family RNA polymerase sigma factor [Streptomyces phaeoluteigriseus]|uniref:Sigma-70 family RNA polymerase sigma factor n=1 Tax=Streptomyces phaeoluteigriseus TaxID=114686 RepID=A0ABY4ZN44_9ACTN|nr:sigma-70 family RNA polymerase sigma factor [Streptomyces phaeoluteigriseus]USQ89712.1 sigma-70 family RNA polymerase sigma factor [Streptomyces phaeoluteigriseus]